MTPVCAVCERVTDAFALINGTTYCRKCLRRRKEDDR